MKTNELTGVALDWAVAKCENIDLIPHRGGWIYAAYSSNWAQGGPIIEREVIQLTPDEYTGTWSAYMTNEGESYDYTGPTPLIAAMRCYVASKMGDNVDIPKELT